MFFIFELFCANELVEMIKLIAVAKIDFENVVIYFI